MKNKTLSGFSICPLLFALLLLHGCMAASALKGKEGLDVNTVAVGMSKAEVEQVLGSPIREWVTSFGVVYRVYAYDAGIPPSAGDAAAHIFMDVATAGIWELFGAFGELGESPHKREQMAVSYDDNGIVIGIFDQFGDFDVLPDDGRSEKRRER